MFLESISMVLMIQLHIGHLIRIVLHVVYISVENRDKMGLSWIESLPQEMLDEILKVMLSEFSVWLENFIFL